MSFADEWTTSGTGPAVGMRLNGWQAEHGTSEAASLPDLDISTAALRGLSKEMGTLHGRMTTALTNLEQAHTGLTTATKGFACTAELKKVRGSWEDRLQDVRNECERLQTAFTKAAEAHDKNEDNTKQEMSSLSSRPSWREDRPNSPITNFS
ncbi:hypothetical protein L7D48_17485 [Streptomyces sp. S1A]|uniref:hypothetical protein n=1 Tax=Streptomyces sp. ICN903 TaxID=2964654 RepID=UPI001ED9FEFD|nr:hypothetical protein [Streptomyces sp. ICN903]MCG3042340.1 hypothetical protein [Streptomyces sp. ICN903]